MKKLGQAIAFVLFILMFSACFDSDVPTDNLITMPASPYTSFRRIPGVTWEEIAQIEALQKQRISFNYGAYTSTESFYNEYNEIRGFTTLFCNWLTLLFDIPFHPKFYTWSDLINGLESGEIDFTGDLTESDERREIYLMTDAIANVK